MDGRYQRLLGIIGLVCLRGALVVWAGTVPPNPDQHRYPGNEQVVENYHTYLGKQVRVGGTVVQTGTRVNDGGNQRLACFQIGDFQSVSAKSAFVRLGR